MKILLAELCKKDYNKKMKEKIKKFFEYLYLAISFVCVFLSLFILTFFIELPVFGKFGILENEIIFILVLWGIPLVTATIGTLFFIRYWKRNHSKIMLIVPIVLFLLLFTFMILATNPRPNREGGRDARRISDIKNIQLALEICADKNQNLFPKTSENCPELSLLENDLVKNKFISAIPKDPLGPQYNFSVSADRKQYILKAVLENKEHSRLNSGEDLDGFVMGCDCNDPNYCVSN